MKIQFSNASRLVAAITLSLCSLLSIAMPIAQAAPGSDSCVWTGLSGTDDNFSTATNWSGCSGAAPVNGDSLTFDTASATAATLSNDESNLAVSGITFSGATAAAYTLNGNALSVGAGGITNTSADSQNVNTDITLSASQSWTGTQSINMNGQLDLATFNLTLPSSDSELLGGLSGSGNLTVSGGNSSIDTIGLANTGYSGTVEIQSGTVVITDPQALGTGTVQVDNGATLDIDVASTSATLSNNLILSGDGVSAGTGAIMDCLGDNGTDCNTVATNLTLSGNVSLQANATVGNGTLGGSGTVTVTVTGALSGAFTLTAVPSLNVALVINSSNNTSNTPNTTTTTSTSTNSSTGSTPGTPDTGLAARTANPFAILGVSVAAALTLLVIGRRVRALGR